MSYNVMDHRILDYEICEYDGSRLKYRGPKQNLNEPYVAFLGATETFGKFIAEPFPRLTSKHLPAHDVNLGVVNGGLDAYLNDPAVLKIAKGAQLRVVQVVGALNLSNHYFDVHPRRNDRLIRPHETLQRLFPMVDFADFSFTKAMLLALRDAAPERYQMVCRELQDLWIKRMTQLLDHLGDKTVLLWFAGSPPPEDALHDAADPMLIDRDLVAKMRKKASAYVEVVPDTNTSDRDTNGMVFEPKEARAAKRVMGPSAHREAALALQEVCRLMLR